MTHALRLAIDIGGTFTDTVLMDDAGAVLATAKTPTTPAMPADGALDGAGDVLARVGADWSDITGFIHGTTLATNALIERRGARVATITTAGFRDILEIAYERRYSQYAIDIEKPDLLVPRARAFTIGERVDVHGAVRAPLDEEAVPALAAALRAARVEAVAICLLHSYANPAHERRLATLLRAHLPDVALSLSHEVSPEAREFDRLCTTIANAYIQPLMAQYLDAFQRRFEAAGLRCPILMMTAGGGMTTVATAAQLPIRLVESGPAGGAILAARLAQQAGADEVLSFDMGGTTAKLCLIDGFRPQSARRFEIARAERFVKGSGMPVRIPVIEMIEIGAGGGSTARVDRIGRVQVGPHSAGSEPGPAAFGRGGVQATVTDADVVQGLIDPARFAEGRLAIDEDAARAAVARDVAAPLGVAADRAAFGISDIVDENMASAGRMHAVESGKDLGARVMIAFGGNGPLHATRVARRSQIRRILIPRDPGVGSAVGFLHAPVSFEIVRSRHSLLEGLDIPGLNAFFAEMQAEAERVVDAGARGSARHVRRVAFMRYRGQGHEIEIPLPDRPLEPGDVEVLRAGFEAEYSRQFTRTVPGMVIEVLNWAISVSTPPGDVAPVAVVAPRAIVAPERTREVLCDVTGDWRAAGVFDRADLRPGDRVAGPALITEPQTTTFVSADFAAEMDGAGCLWLTRLPEETAP
ncbi:hydantoinase/oxoprolinase family protein [uncultured Tateyamaria sp.]|uniref:hydantoinase/oxoprolinase family protein n=1 Tax=uncultured Tateyamaria sp. TaxID=455651 RepID=UPI002615811D|nr:hydantoinase/oxoprolinase family protein [uncultured Tateyamaria sp.]